MPQQEILDERSLSADEIALIKSIFGSELNPALVTVYHVPHHPELECRMYRLEGTNDLYCPDTSYQADFACDMDFEVRGSFVHEMAHIWQFQNNVSSKQSLRGQRNIAEYEMRVARQKVDAAQDAWERYRDRVVAMHRVKAFNARQLAYFEGKLDSIQAKQDSIVANDFGPKRTRFEDLDEKLDRTLKIQGELTHKMPIDQADPVLPSGRRTSEVAWEIPEVRRHFATRQAMVDAWRDYELDDYDYLNVWAPETCEGVESFFDLNEEQQAKMIEEYYLLTKGVEPVTTRQGARLNGQKRPPLWFYQSFIPFVSPTAASKSFKH